MSWRSEDRTADFKRKQLPVIQLFSCLTGNRLDVYAPALERDDVRINHPPDLNKSVNNTDRAVGLTHSGP